MKKALIAITLALVATAGYCGPVSLVQGKSLLEQTKLVASQEGYTVLWKLHIDDLALSAAHEYSTWEDAIYGATKQLSKTTLDDLTIADLAAPVICDGSKTIVVTTLNDARKIVRDGQQYDCHALGAN